MKIIPIKSNRIYWIAIIAIALMYAGYLYNKYRVAPTVAFYAISLTDLNNANFEMKKLKSSLSIHLITPQAICLIRTT